MKLHFCQRSAQYRLDRPAQNFPGPNDAVREWTGGEDLKTLQEEQGL